MSDESELARLRADLEVIERYEGRMYALAAAKAEIGNKIDKLEADADPWREAKEMLADKALFRSGRSRLKPVAELYDHLAAENARLEKRVAELEDPDVSDPDRYTLGDFAVLKTAQEIIRYAMDRNPDRFDDTRICRRAIAAIADFAEKVRHWRGLKNQLPYRWGSLGRDTAHLLDLSFDVTEPPSDYDPDLVRPIADMQPPFEGPIVGFDPVLDPARVLATACGIMEEQGWIMNDRVREELKCGAKPYPLKKGGE